MDTLEALRVRYSGTRLLRRGPAEQTISMLPTGLAALDAVLQGGLPRGRLTELAAHGSAGQETLAAAILRQAQAGSGAAAWIDSTGAIPLDLLAAQGVAIDRLLVLRPDGPEQTLALLREMMRERGIAATAYPVHSLAEREQLDRSLAGWLPALEQSQGVLLTLLDLAAPSGSFYASLRLGLVHQSWLADAGRITGYRTRATVLKNKLGPSGAAVDLDITLAEDIS